ncbi:MAG: hypothetical protein AAF765_00860 [Bacteroidota bacterium]
MKHTKKTVMLFTMGGLLLMATACQQNPRQQEEPEPVEEEEVVVEPPENIISIAQSKMLYDNYTRNRVAPIMRYEIATFDDEEFEVSRYVDFDYKMMKQYIAYVEQEAEKAKVDVSTFRFYFANYPNEEKFPDGKKVIHPRQNSIFVLPTLNKKGRNMGFYIDAEGRAALIKNAMKPNDSIKGYGSNLRQNGRSHAGFVPSFAGPILFQEELSLIMNHGNSSPPPPGDF